ncbi:alpha/beta fold hydrolase [Pannonibacter tanglangensis]|uniref:Alpha/beta fold hydrolase n=1 Tax=Pannonibacter tanglangensis TaxID=2750084 RepID=A0ABW9ZJB2_9HYPH|nr:alpha/beta hydrolase [Pannonibacter sp. XCT-34]NBN64456.1 alpha/beta fold hydrolase [Pannonibacter sp. XCT-34]
MGGDGPPLLLLHGFPQTHVMWHPLAGALARHFRVILPDLPGYGESDLPEGGPEAMGKREVARDLVALMQELGHASFLLCGHDRGGRVAYRMALDHPQAVRRIAVLDILPTQAYWQRMDRAFALKVYHWAFLAQPEPLPERLIAAAPEFYLDHTMASWTGRRDLSAFAPEALAAYRTAFAASDRIRAACQDYRAGATVDLAHDEADLAAGHRITAPLCVLWGGHGIAPGAGTPLDVWRQWATDVSGSAIDSGHFLVEENPAATLAALLPFLLAAA